MARYRIVFLFCFYLFFRTFANAQFTVEEYRNELNIKFDVIDEKRFEKSIKIMLEASKLEQESLMIFDAMDENEMLEGISPTYKKGIKKLQSASEKYKEAHALIYSIFDDNCVKSKARMKKMKGYSTGMQKAKYYETQGQTSIKHSQSIREIVIESDKTGWIQYKMAEAFELERLAIRDKGRALQIYQDFPVEYDYGWENDVTLEELDKFFKDPSVNRPPDDLFIQKEPNQEVSDTIYRPEVVFKVQIAAHNVPINEEKLRWIYSGDEEVTETYVNNWYKYTIGEFSNIKDADRLRVKSKVGQAFIVAFIDNEKVTIKEALDQVKANNQ